MALSTRSSQRPTMGATRARQGRLGRHVLWVLVFGLALVVLGFFAAYTWKSGDFASATSDNGRPKPEARMFNAPEPAPNNNPPQDAAARGEAPPAPVGQ